MVSAGDNAPVFEATNYRVQVSEASVGTTSVLEVKVKLVVFFIFFCLVAMFPSIVVQRKNLVFGTAFPHFTVRHWS